MTAVPDSNHVTLTINGLTARVAKGTLLVEAAKTVGIEIPVFCYHPKLQPVGACRMCLVEIDRMPRLQTACTTPAADGMVVRSTSRAAVEGQNAVLELLLANHPLDCPICDKGGECPLQDNAFRYGLGASRMAEEKRHLDKAYPLSELIVLDRERCIMCLRCTRFQQEIAGDHALAVVDRGGDSVIGVNTGEVFDSPFSGNTVELCPVGALTTRSYRFRARPWDLRRTATTCTGCAVGCNVSLHARDGSILRLVSREHREVDDGWLCDRGRFTTMPARRGAPSQRPRRPLVREGGALVEATLEVALARAATRLREGPAAVLASAALTNEAVFQLAGPLRATLPDITLGFTPNCVRSWPLRGRIADLASARRILLVGLDPWSELPVLALWLRKAIARGAPLVVLDERNGLFRDCAAWLRTPRDALHQSIAELHAALHGNEAGSAVRRAAEALAGEGPAVVLAGVELARDPRARALLADLATRLGATANGGVAGAPPLAANGRGVQELAPEAADRAFVAANGELTIPVSALLVVDTPVPRVSPGTQVVVATAHELRETAGIDVVLPMLHHYEQAGSLTNMEGRVQQIQAIAAPPIGPQADYALIGALLNALGAPAPRDLAAVRSALGFAHPNWAASVNAPLAARGCFNGAEIGAPR